MKHPIPFSLPGLGARGVCLLAILFLSAVPGFAQSDAGESDYVRLSETEEIQLARSAAPAAVSADASIYVIRDGTYNLSVEGSNNNVCFVGRSMPKSLEPICYDEEGAKTIFPWEVRYMELRIAGTSPEERERILAEELGSGALQIPKRAVMSYMLSSGQHLFNPDTGRDAGNWKPHLMIYMPGATQETFGLTGPTSSLFMARAGTPIAHLIVVAPEFVDPGAE